MALFNIIEPRRFSFKPRYYTAPGETRLPHQIKFRSLGLYDRHGHSRFPLRLLLLAAAVALLFFWLNRHTTDGANAVKITLEDVRGR